MSRKILMVEERADLLEILRSRLEHEGFDVVAAQGGERAPGAALVEKPDLVILDVDLPMRDELEVCRRIRREAASPGIPILVFSSKGEPIEGILEPENGADDFITRPCDLPELIARVRALLRRATSLPPARRVRAGGIDLDRDRYVVSVDGSPVRLTTKEFELLSLLMEAGGRVVTRDVLLERVWSYGRGAGIQSRTLDVHIRSLRRKLGTEGRRIVTIRSVGYRMSLARDWIEFGSEGLAKES